MGGVVKSVVAPVKRIVGGGGVSQVVSQQP